MGRRQLYVSRLVYSKERLIQHSWLNDEKFSRWGEGSCTFHGSGAPSKEKAHHTFDNNYRQLVNAIAGLT